MDAELRTSPNTQATQPPGDLGWHLGMVLRGYQQRLDDAIDGMPEGFRGFQVLPTVVHREPPTDDFEALDIQPNDEDILIALSLSVALSRRAISEGKRYTGKSGVHPLAAAARTAQVDADRMFWSRTHKLKAGSFADGGGQ